MNRDSRIGLEKRNQWLTTLAGDVDAGRMQSEGLSGVRIQDSIDRIWKARLDKLQLR
jgi:hypothetical protein